MKFIRHIPAYIDMDEQKVFEINRIEDVFELDFMRRGSESIKFKEFIICTEELDKNEIATIYCLYGETKFLIGNVVHDKYLKI